MQGVGGYRVVHRLAERGLVQVWSARGEGDGGGEDLCIKAVVYDPLFERESFEAQAGQFLSAVEAQRALVLAGAGRWARVIEVGRTEDQAAAVFDRFGRSAQRLIVSRAVLDDRLLGWLVGSVVEGLAELGRLGGGRAWGRLKSSNIFIAERGELGEAGVVLSDLQAPELCGPEDALRDAVQLGRLIFQLVTRRELAEHEMLLPGVGMSAEWARLGPSGVAWLERCNRLLGATLGTAAGLIEGLGRELEGAAAGGRGEEAGAGRERSVAGRRRRRVWVLGAIGVVAGGALAGWWEGQRDEGQRGEGQATRASGDGARIEDPKAPAGVMTRGAESVAGSGGGSGAGGGSGGGGGEPRLAEAGSGAAEEYESNRGVAREEDLERLRNRAAAVLSALEGGRMSADLEREVASVLVAAGSLQKEKSEPFLRLATVWQRVEEVGEASMPGLAEPGPDEPVAALVARWRRLSLMEDWPRDAAGVERAAALAERVEGVLEEEARRGLAAMWSRAWSAVGEGSDVSRLEEARRVLGLAERCGASEGVRKAGAFNVALVEARGADEAGVRGAVERLREAAAELGDASALRAAEAAEGALADPPVEVEGGPRGMSVREGAVGGPRVVMALGGVEFAFARVGSTSYVGETEVTLEMARALAVAAGGWGAIDGWSFETPGGMQVWQESRGDVVPARRAPAANRPTGWMGSDQELANLPEAEALWYHAGLRAQRPGEPTLQHPVQWVSAEVAVLLAGAAGCRLPSEDEMRALLAMDGGTPNLRGREWVAQLAFWPPAARRTSDGRHPFRGVFAPNDEGRRNEEPASGVDDGELWLRAQRVGAGVRDVRGNVAEFVTSGGGFGVMGESALSPPGVEPSTAYPVGADDRYSDVGFRLAFTASERRPPAVTERVRAALEGVRFAGGR